MCLGATASLEKQLCSLDLEEIVYRRVVLSVYLLVLG